ncbi:alpha/beta hydrolase [Embleya sp. NPDC059237]|uniref:alpha/beta hydrolase n=1 Tax=Embleya sp. NPDC059237 TaxID=3346784 RepID=UPI0036A794E2
MITPFQAASFRRSIPVTVALLLAAGCTGGSGDSASNAAAGKPVPTQVTTGTAAATPPPKPKGAADPALRAFYEQKISWKACTDDPKTKKKDEREFRCGTFKVPLDYTAPGGRSLDIAVMQHPAAKPDRRIGSLVLNPGGPGGSGQDFVKYGFADFDGPLHDRYDILGFDPRGVADSAPVRCLGDKARDERNARDSPRDPVERKADGERSGKEFSAACQAESGELLPFVGTRNAARDMDVLRAAVGDDKLDYLGVSYGTYLGTMYLDEFPDRAGHMVLDAVVDPAADKLDASIDQTIGFERSFRAFAADCAARAGCPLGGDPAKAAEIGATFLDALQDKPLRTAYDGRKLTSSLGWTGTNSLLYGDKETAWKYLREALALAMNNKDGSHLLFYADNYLGRDEKGHYDNSSDSRSAIRCADGAAPAPSPERIQQVLAKLKADAPLLSKDAVASDIEGPGCEFWPYKTPEQPHVIRAEGAAPVLVVGTTGDPATPYAASEKLAKDLAHASLLTLQGEGHGAFGRSRCVDAAVAAYIIEGRLPAAGTRCTDGK